MQYNFIHDVEEYRFDMFDQGTFRLGYFVSKSKSKKQDKENEDCLFIRESEDKLILGVADGAGGHPRGRDASFTVGKEIETFSFNGNNTYEFINLVNRKVRELKVGAKTTLAMGTLAQDVVHFHCVGDSEIIHWNAIGDKVYNSIPHSSHGHMIRAGVLSQEQSLEESDRYYVDSLLGDEFVHIDSTTEIEVKKGHTILMGSDGLFDNISHAMLTEKVATGAFEKSFNELVDICIRQESWIKDDDISFILLRKIKA